MNDVRGNGAHAKVLLATIAVLLSITIAGHAAAQTETPQSASPAGSEAKQQWAIAYVMSYDNNLEPAGKVILERIEAGLRDTQGITVTVLADFTDTDGLLRMTITAAGRTTERLPTDNSASEEVVEGYLSWVATTHRAKRYAVVFLDHGGNLDDMCIDENPGVKGAKHWLSARLMGPVMRRFREAAPGPVELLFLQQCGRGSIDNLYNFRDAATTIVASQTSVGSPNTYYTETLRWLATKPDARGRELAHKVVTTDSDFTNYAVVDGAALSQLPQRLDPVVQAFRTGSPRLVAPRVSRDLRPCFGGWGQGPERSYDLVRWLEAAAELQPSTSSARPAVQSFSKWVQEELILHHQRNPREAERTGTWTGLSLFVPDLAVQRAQYKGYPLYEASQLDDFWARMFRRIGKF